MTTLFGNEQETVQHQALYRKYRPSGFEGLIGQDHVKTTLANALNHGTVSHAYLFTGPRGTGKTSTAKLFARALNCEEPQGFNPCGNCQSCKSEVNDIIELDAASNNSVDDIRQLRENVVLSPMYGKYKIYILDEVHMLTTQAFNAFLKTLEEPPAHAIFILATTEVHKLPATILSRCQRFDFRRISNQDIVSRLKYVLEQENRVAEETALNLIAQVSAGGMRDALSLLDQALSLKTNTTEILTLTEILALTGAVDVRVIGKLISLIASKNTEEALMHFNQSFESGKEPKFFVEEMMIYLRDILVFKKLGPTAELKKGNTDENFHAVANSVDVELIYIYLEELQETLSNSKFHHNLQLLLEMTIIRMINGNQASLQQQINELRNMIASGVPTHGVHQTNNVSEFELTQTQVPQTSNASVLESAAQTKETSTSNVPDFVFGQTEEISTSNVPDFVFGQTEEISTSNVPDFAIGQLEETATSNIPDFTFGQTEEPQISNVPMFDFDQTEELQPQTSTVQVDNQEVEIDDPIGFIEIAKDAASKGIDWTTQIPSEVQTDIPSPGIDNELLSGLDTTLPEPSISTNIILSDREKTVLKALSSATKQLREQFNGVREFIIQELGNQNISTKSIFREFSVGAVNEGTIILIHQNKVQVKIIDKPIHRKNIEDTIRNVYRPHEIIPITEAEWNNVTQAFKGNK